MPTDSATAAATDPTTGDVRRSAGMMHAYRLREVAFRMALDVAGVTAEPTEELCSRARDFAAVVKAWSDTNTQARIERGRPLPGSLRPERKQPKRRTRAQGPLGDAAPKPLSSQKDNAPVQTNVASPVPAPPQAGSDTASPVTPTE